MHFPELVHVLLSFIIVYYLYVFICIVQRITKNETIPTVLVPWTRQAEITVAMIEATNMITPKIKIPEIEVLHFKTLFEETNAQLGGCHVLTILNLRRWPACRCRSSTRARSGPASAPPHPPTPGNSLLFILSSNSNNIYQEQHNQH